MTFSQDANAGAGVSSSPQRGVEERGLDLAPVRIRLLGTFEVRVGDRLVGENRWRLRKAASLVRLLALSPNHRMHRERVMDLLWPDLEPEAAANNLHYALHVARRTIEPRSAARADYLRLRGGELHLCPESALWVDVRAFEEAASHARRVRDTASCAAALDLYAGDLLPDERYDAWTEARREQLRRTRIDLELEMARLYEERGEDRRAIEVLETVVAEDPSREEAHVRLMRLHAAAGHPYGAIMQYERLKETFRRDPARVPDDATRRMYRGILERPAPTPARAGPTARTPEAPNGLPAALSTFVGREREMTEVRRHLSMTRLLTLTGMGGVGKTRLALEVARNLASSHPDGVWLAELAPLSDGGLVPRAVAAAVGIGEEQGRPLLETIVEALRAKRALLLLDNCEHLVDACARFADTLLSSCPDLRVLATSREPLGIAGESVWPVGSLSTPEGGEGAADENLIAYESVRLFVDRVRTRAPGFELTEENAGSVAEVCRRLDGIPLAIELATARMTVLTVDQVAARLDDALELLTVGSRTADPRHQTLRAAMDWSYEPLTPKERRLFGHLSVFAGGWTLTAAEAVGWDEVIGHQEVLDLLGSLVDKSLVIVSAGARGPARYGMLEPVRQYAAERADPVLREAARRRHAMHVLGVVEEAEPHLLGSTNPGPWLARLFEERGNLGAALAWALEAGEGRDEVGLRISVALVRFWGVFGLSEVHAWLERMLARNEGVQSPLRVRALNESAFLTLFSGGFARATAMLDESLALARELGDSAGAAGALRSLVYAHAHAGDSARVARLREEAEDLLSRPLDGRSRAGLLEALTLATLDAYEHEAALAYAAWTREAYEALGDVQGTIVSLAALGMVSLSAGHRDQARAYLLQNLELLRAMSHKMGIAYCLLGLGGVAQEEERAARAARLWGAAEALREGIGVRLTPFDRAHFGYEERIADARALIDAGSWERAWAEGRSMSPAETIEFALADADAVPTAGVPAVPEAAPVLTARERTVAEEVARGLTNRQVANAMGISERTVHGHVRHILKKLGLASRAQITAWVIEQRSRRRPPHPRNLRSPGMGSER